MGKFAVGVLALFLFLSCDQEPQQSGAARKLAVQDTVAFTPPTVTVLADLPDSLQPEVILVSDLPKPVTTRLKPPEIVPAGFSTVMQNYTTEQGLALDVISCSFADSKGNLWFGTFVGGVSRYDGKSFTTYSKSQGIVSNDIHGITEDKNGNIWFATSHGISTFDGSTFTTIGSFRDVNSIYCDNSGAIWFGTQDDGLGRYKGHVVTMFSEVDGLTGHDIYAVREDHHGTIWIGTEHGLCTYDGKTFTGVESADPWTKEKIVSICIDRSGIVWAGGFNGYMRYDGATFSRYPFKDPTSFASAIHEDRLGNIWVTLGGDGIAFYDGKSFTNINRSHGLLNNHVVGICEDRSGNLWFSTDAGISKYAGTAFTNYTQAQGLVDNSIRSIVEAQNGDLWFASNSRGVSKYDGESFTNYRTDQGLMAELFWSITQTRSGDIWMGTVGKGAIQFDGSSFTHYNDERRLKDSDVMCIYEDSKNRVLLGTQHGVVIFDGISYTTITERQGLANDRVWVILEDKRGKYWIGTEGGLSCFDGKTITSYSTAQGLGDDHVKSIVEDVNGNLWIATYGGGLSRFDGNTFMTLTLENGLPDDIVTQVAMTKEGSIVLGTNYGIGIISGFTLNFKTDSYSSDQQSLALPKHCGAQNDLTNSQLNRYNPVIEIYNSQTGFPVKDVNRGQRGIFLDSRGILWIATGSEKSGLVRLDYSAVKRDNDPPSVNLLSLKVNNELICWHDLLIPKSDAEKPAPSQENNVTPAYITEEITTFGKTLTDELRTRMQTRFRDIKFDGVRKDYPIPQNLILPYKHNHITIEFAAIEPSKPALVRYQYKLDGYDNNWSTPSHATSATYGNINAGTYTFHVRAQSPTGVWCEPISYSLTVLPPWYSTWWAYAGYAITFVLSLWGLGRWREGKLRSEKLKLERTVDKRTEEVVAEKKEAERQRQRSDELLLNILPEEVAEELKAKGSAVAKQFEYVTVMFTDFKDFTKISEALSPEELVAEIDLCYKAFDEIITRHNIEKIKTIGDSYMCAGGLPVANTTNAIDVVRAAIEIQQFMHEHMQQRMREGKVVFENRIGIHTGSVVAGIVGVKKFAYDIWGDTVNIASRMESAGEAGRVNISGSTYELVKDQFKCTYRGKLEAKNKGEVDMYFVEVR